MSFNPAVGSGFGLRKIGSDLPADNQPPTQQIVTAPAPRISFSPPVPVNNNVIVPSTYPGIKIVRAELRTSLHQWNPVSWNFGWRTGPIAPFTNIAYFSSEHGVVQIPNNINQFFVEGTLNVNLKLLIEGKYVSNDDLMTRSDSVSVFLRNTQSPYEVVDSTKGRTDSLTHSGLFLFSNAPSGSYYIVVKHYQSIETWSKQGGESLSINSQMYNYDFRTASSQAFGNNLTLKGSRYCLYSGDVNQDGGVNLSDLIMIYNDAYSFASNNPVTDLNGDNLTDLTDLIIGYSNSSNFVYKITP